MAVPAIKNKRFTIKTDTIIKTEKKNFNQIKS